MTHPPVTIRFNGEAREVSAGAMLADLLGEHPRRGIAVAVNKRVVPRSEHATTPVHDGDTIDVVTAMQGG